MVIVALAFNIFFIFDSVRFVRERGSERENNKKFLISNRLNYLSDIRLTHLHLYIYVYRHYTHHKREY